MVDFSSLGLQTPSNQEGILREIARDKKIFLEVGSWVGQSTAIFAAEAKKNGGIVYVVDWWKGNEGTDLIGRAIANDVYKIFENNMKELDLFDVIKVFNMESCEAHKEIEDGIFDLVYIDCDHRYSRVSEDLKNYFPKVKDDGFMAGHDFEGFDYNEEFVELDYVNNRHNGVIKAVTEKFKDVKDMGGIWLINKSVELRG